MAPRSGSELLSAGAAFGIVPYGLETRAAAAAGERIPARRRRHRRHDLTRRRRLGRGRGASEKRISSASARSRGPTTGAPTGCSSSASRRQKPTALVPGAHLRLPGTTVGSDGWVTSAALSPTLDRTVALALLRGGHARLGETLTVHDLDQHRAATIVSRAFLRSGRQAHPWLTRSRSLAAQSGLVAGGHVYHRRPAALGAAAAHAGAPAARGEIAENRQRAQDRRLADAGRR